MRELIEAANEIDVLNAPINIPSLVGGDENSDPPKHVAKGVVDKIRRFRNLIHPARALGESYDPRTFTHEQLEEFKEMYESVLHSLLSTSSRLVSTIYRELQNAKTTRTQGVQSTTRGPRQRSFGTFRSAFRRSC